MPHWVSKGCKSLVYGWFSAFGGRLVLKWRQCLNNPLFHLATIFMLPSQLNHNKMSKKDLSLCGRRIKVHPIKEFSCATFQHELNSQGFKKAVNGQCQTPASVKTIWIFMRIMDLLRKINQKFRSCWEKSIKS